MNKKSLEVRDNAAAAQETIVLHMTPNGISIVRYYESATCLPFSWDPPRSGKTAVTSKSLKSSSKLLNRAMDPSRALNTIRSLLMRRWWEWSEWIAETHKRPMLLRNWESYHVYTWNFLNNHSNIQYSQLISIGTYFLTGNIGNESETNNML